MGIIINAPTLTGKTKFAELIMGQLAKSKVLQEKNVLLRKGMSMKDKFSQGISRYEGIIWDDFKPADFDFNECCKFIEYTGKSDEIRVFRGKESNRLLKVSIFPTVECVYEWMAEKTNTLEKIGQLLRRFWYTFRMVGEPTSYDYHHQPKWSLTYPIKVCMEYLDLIS